jgi:hypothetical protein
MKFHICYYRKPYDNGGEYRETYEVIISDKYLFENMQGKTIDTTDVDEAYSYIRLLITNLPSKINFENKPHDKIKNTELLDIMYNEIMDFDVNFDRLRTWLA